jgi:putative transposase
VSISGLICLRPGHRTRFLHRTIVYHGRKNEPKGFNEHDWKRQLRAAHHQLPGGNIVLIWDNLSGH